MSVAAERSFGRGSIASMKSSGDSGSPYLKPQPCAIGSRGIPFRSTLDVDETRMEAIQLVHLKGNPPFL